MICDQCVSYWGGVANASDTALVEAMFEAPVALAVLPLTLMFVGGLKVVQTATLVVSLPLLAVGVLMSWSLARQLRADHPDG